MSTIGPKDITPDAFGFVKVQHAVSMRETSAYLDPFGRFTLTCVRERGSERGARWHTSWILFDRVTGRHVGVCRAYAARESALRALQRYLLRGR